MINLTTTIAASAFLGYTKCKTQGWVIPLHIYIYSFLGGKKWSTFCYVYNNCRETHRDRGVPEFKPRLSPSTSTDIRLCNIEADMAKILDIQLGPQPPTTPALQPPTQLKPQPPAQLQPPSSSLTLSLLPSLTLSLLPSLTLSLLPSLTLSLLPSFSLPPSSSLINPQPSGQLQPPAQLQLNPQPPAQLN